MSSIEPDRDQDLPDAPADEAGRSSESPFEAAPRDLPTTGKGCSRMALAGCGLIALVLGLGVLTMILKATDLVAWSLSRIRSEVERTLPDELPEAERQRLETAFDAALRRIDSGELDPVAFQALQGELMRFARRSRPPTVEEVRALIEALESFAAIGSVEPETGSGRVASRFVPHWSR